MYVYRNRLIVEAKSKSDERAYTKREHIYREWRRFIAARCCCNLCLMANTIIAPNYAKHPVLIKRVRAASTAAAAAARLF
jgi:hypothetical protein